MIRLALALLLALAPAAAAQTIEDPEGTVTAQGRDDASEAGFRDWVADFRPRALEAGLPAAVFDREMRRAEFLPKVVERDRRQSEFTKTIWDYLDVAVSADRVALGEKALAANAGLLARIEAAYGVDRRSSSRSGGWNPPMAPTGAIPTRSPRWRRSPMTAAAPPSSKPSFCRR